MILSRLLSIFAVRQFAFASMDFHLSFLRKALSGYTVLFSEVVCSFHTSLIFIISQNMLYEYCTYLELSATRAKSRRYGGSAVRGVVFGSK